MLPKSVVSVGSMAVLPMVIARLPHLAQCCYILPVLSVDTEISVIQTILGEMRESGDAPLRILSTTDSFPVGGHVPAVIANTKRNPWLCNYGWWW